MPPSTITASEAVREFSKILKRVRKDGEFIIEKNGRPYASLGPIRTPLTGAQILKLWSKRPRARLTPSEANAFANDFEIARKNNNAAHVSKWS